MAGVPRRENAGSAQKERCENRVHEIPVRRCTSKSPVGLCFAKRYLAEQQNPVIDSVECGSDTL